MGVVRSICAVGSVGSAGAVGSVVSAVVFIRTVVTVVVRNRCKCCRVVLNQCPFIILCITRRCVLLTYVYSTWQVPVFSCDGQGGTEIGGFQDFDQCMVFDYFWYRCVNWCVN